MDNLETFKAESPFYVFAVGSPVMVESGKSKEEAVGKAKRLTDATGKAHEVYQVSLKKVYTTKALQSAEIDF